MRKETDPVSEVLCSLEYRAMAEARKVSNPDFNVQVTYNVLCIFQYTLKHSRYILLIGRS
jgi:hypothetical protein